MMTTRKQLTTLTVFIIATLYCLPLSAAEKAANEETSWDVIKEFLFQDRHIDENNPVTKIIAPKRAANGADVTVRIVGLSPQTDQKHIKNHYLVVDENPSPVVGKFSLSTANKLSDIETRIRVDQYSHVRVISETQDGRLYMTKAFVKSSGGCSAPPVSDNAMAALNLGKTKLIEERLDSGLRKIRLSVLHPNNSGLQRDIVSNLTIPPHFVTEAVVTNSDGEVVFSVEGDISFSENPSFEFYYKPENIGDELVARITDSQEKTYTSTRLPLAKI